jgi:endo-1,3(4)-beta-glucanase
VYTAAVIGSLDHSWLNEARNKDWVNALIRDYANPVEDQLFPFSRSFDWYHGHSWATGIDALVDGKNQESTSEDSHALYAIKLWASVVGDSAMESRANLQLAILKRSLHSYFLFDDDNQNQPARFIGNSVSGVVSRSTSFRALPNYLSYLRIKSITQHGSTLGG